MHRIMIAAVATMLATPALADQRIVIAHGVPIARVSYAGLDLKSGGGRKQMAHRIRVAAEKLCLGAVVETEAGKNGCYVAAVTSGLTQMNALAGL